MSSNFFEQQESTLLGVFLLRVRSGKSRKLRDFLYYCMEN